MISLPNSNHRVTFDDAGRVTAVAQPGGKTVTYTYDNASRREAMIDPDGGRPLGTGRSKQAPLLGVIGARRGRTMRPGARRRSRSRTPFDTPLRARLLRMKLRTTMGYDDASQVTLIRHSKSDDTQVAKYEYAYNDAGVRTSVLEGNGDRVTWSYDNAWRLTREARSGDNAYDITYSYDSVGNRATKLTGGVTTTYSYNAGDAVTGADAGGTLTTYSWDDAGNNTVVNANGTLTTYTWDGESRLATIQTASGTITLAYDAGGLRRSRQDASTTRKYVWDGQNLLIETDGDGTTVAQYTGALDTYGPIVSQRRSSTSRFYHPSVLGSIETLTGPDAATTDSYILDAWGVQHASSGSTTNPFRYIGALGYYTEPDLGLAYVRARWLRPATGSWLSVDPESLAGVQVVQVLRAVPGGTLSTRGYALSSPTLVVDPDGEWVAIAIFVVGVVVVVVIVSGCGCAKAGATAGQYVVTGSELTGPAEPRAVPAGAATAARHRAEQALSEGDPEEARGGTDPLERLTDVQTKAGRALRRLDQ